MFAPRPPPYPIWPPAPPTTINDMTVAHGGTVQVVWVPAVPLAETVYVSVGEQTLKEDVEVVEVGISTRIVVLPPLLAGVSVTVTALVTFVAIVVVYSRALLEEVLLVEDGTSMMIVVLPPLVNGVPVIVAVLETSVVTVVVKSPGMLDALAEYSLLVEDALLVEAGTSTMIGVLPPLVDGVPVIVVVLETSVVIVVV